MTKKTSSSEGYVVEEIDIDDILEDDGNLNMGTPRGAAVMDYSLDTFGPVRGVALDKKNKAMAGNKTVKAAKNAGVKKVIVVETDGDVLVATRRRDMDLDDPEDKRGREYSAADNRTNEIGLNWDAHRTAQAAEEGADFSVLFYDDEFARLTGQDDWYLDEEDDRDEDLVDDVVPEMALQPFEHYDYLMVMFRSTLDWSRALDVLKDAGLIKQGFTVSRKTRKVGLCRVIEGSALLDLLTGVNQ